MRADDLKIVVKSGLAFEIKAEGRVFENRFALV